MLVRQRQLSTLTTGDLLPPEFAARLDAIDVLSRKVLSGKLQGERRSKRRGRSVEFDDYRPYTAGDDLRHIDWNVFARFDRFFLKLFQEEEDLSVLIVLDCSASMLAGEPQKLLSAARLAAALSYAALVNNSRVEFAAIGLVPRVVTGVSDGGVLRMEPLRGRRSAQRVVESICACVNAAEAAMAMPAPSGSASSGGDAGARFSAALRLLAANRSGKGVVVLLSDLLVPDAAGQAAGYQDGLRYFAGAAGYDALVVQVLSQGELDPTRETLGSQGRAAVTGDLRLIDIETGSAREITVSGALMAQYRRRAQQFVQGAAEFCTARGMRHAVLTSDADVPQFVLSVLRRQGVVG